VVTLNASEQSAKYRRERNSLRDELAELKAQLSK
jgi:hypothetical protein